MRKCAILLPVWSHWDCDKNASPQETDSNSKNCESLVRHVDKKKWDITVIAASDCRENLWRNTYYIKTRSLKRYVQKANDFLRMSHQDVVLVIEQPYCLHHLIDIPTSILITNPSYQKIDFQNQSKLLVIGCSYSVLDEGVQGGYFDNYCVIRPGFDSNKFCILPNIQREEKVVFASRMIEDKGIFRIHESLNGSGIPVEYYGACKDDRVIAQIKKLKLDWRGESISIVDVLCGAKICMTASLFEDPFPKIAIESQLCGCIFLTSDRGGAKEELPKDQIFDPTDNSSILRCVINHMYGHKSPDENRVWAMKFTNSEMAFEYEQAWEKLLSLPVKLIPRTSKVEIRDGDSLFSLFGEQWTKIYYHPDNQKFRERFPDPNIVKGGFFINVPTDCLPL